MFWPVADEATGTVKLKGSAILPCALGDESFFFLGGGGEMDICCAYIYTL